MNSNTLFRSLRALVVAALMSTPLLCTAGAPDAPDGRQPFGTPVSDRALADYRGGQSVQISEIDLDAQLNDNQALDNVTGNNFVTDRAFAGASGIPTVIQNSGNNVIIQNATILNVEMR